MMPSTRNAIPTFLTVPIVNHDLAILTWSTFSRDESARPGVCSHDILERYPGAILDAHPARLSIRRGISVKAIRAVEKSLHGYFVSGIQHGGRSTALLDRPICQTDARKPFRYREA